MVIEFVNQNKSVEIPIYDFIGDFWKIKCFIIDLSNQWYFWLVYQQLSRVLLNNREYDTDW